MALPSTGAISMSQVRTELGRTGAISLNDSMVRALAGKSSGAISMADLRGKSIVGTPYGGGFYAGRIMIGSQAYALVVSPRAQGEAETVKWKTSATTTPGANSRNDGWANTQAMVQAGIANHPAGAFCRGLSIGGYNDWYLPSRDELEIIYRNLKPRDRANVTYSGENPSAIPPTGNYTVDNPAQTTVEAFKVGGAEALEGGSYWSSTQSSTTTSAYNQNLRDGGANAVGIGSGMIPARAVRRVAI